MCPKERIAKAVVWTRGLPWWVWATAAGTDGEAALPSIPTTKACQSLPVLNLDWDLKAAEGIKCGVYFLLFWLEKTEGREEVMCK